MTAVRRRVRGIAAVLVTLVAGALATTAQGDAHAASGSGGTGARGADTTRLHLHITGCDRCSIALQHAITGGGWVWTSDTKRIGGDQVVSFRLRTSRTHGLSFMLDAPWEGNTGAVPNMVTRYHDRSVDSAVTRKVARNAHRAEGCWAGTRLNAVRLDFHVARVSGLTIEGDPTRMPLAYATHSMSSWKPMVDTYKGTIGNQDAFYCTRPETTKVTFRTPGCAGCELQLLNGTRRPENLWISPSKTVSGDAVAFRVPRPLTRGVSVTVRGPWEGSPPFTTNVVWRYGQHQVGDPVTFTDARSRSRASGCWGGTSESAVSVALTVRQVTVRSTTGSPTPGSIAYADVTQPWLKPMNQVKKGVLGTQEAIVCAK